MRKEQAGLAHRDDIRTFVDFIDADEKRIKHEAPAGEGAQNSFEPDNKVLNWNFQDIDNESLAHP